MNSFYGGRPGRDFQVKEFASQAELVADLESSSSEVPIDGYALLWDETKTVPDCVLYQKVFGTSSSQNGDIVPGDNTIKLFYKRKVDFTKALKVTTNAATAAENARNLAKAWAVGSQDTSEPLQNNNAKYYAEFANDRAKDSEAWAVGTRSGQTDPSYSNNNSKYYSQQASGSATKAQSYAKGGTNSRTGENTDNAQYYKTLAQSYAKGHTGSRTGEDTDNAEQYKINAQLSAEDSEAWAVGTRDGEDVPDTDDAYHNNAKHWAEKADKSSVIAGKFEKAASISAFQASGNATSAAESAKDSEAWAVGTRGGQVDPSYSENNAKYYSDEASDSATRAKSYAVGGTGTRQNENTDNAQYYCGEANRYAGSANVAKDIVAARLQEGLDKGLLMAKNVKQTLFASAWVGDIAPYSQTFSLDSGSLKTDQDGAVHIAAGASESEVSAAVDAELWVSNQGVDSITIQARGIKPSINIPIEIDLFYPEDKDIREVGSFNTTLGTMSDEWLACDGSGVNREDYPQLVPLLQTSVKRDFASYLPRTYYPDNTTITPLNSYYYNGYWVIVCDGGYKNSSRVLHTPVVYFTNDIINGQWSEQLLAPAGYTMTGICYHTEWNKWVAYGYKYVSDVETYPYIFYATELTGPWTGLQLSDNSCMIMTGCSAQGKLVLIGHNPFVSTAHYRYLFSASTVGPFNEFTYDAPGHNIYQLTFGDGYWVYPTGRNSYFYAINPAGNANWAQVKISDDSNLSCCTIVYNNEDHKWYAGGHINASSGWLKYAYLPGYEWTDVPDSDGTIHMHPIEKIYYSHGAWVATDLNGMFYMVSRDQMKTWNIYSDDGETYFLTAKDNIFMLGKPDAVKILQSPECDAILPTINPEYGTTYIKAK